MTGESPYVFPRPDGTKLGHLSRLLGQVVKKFDLSLPTVTTVRKTIMTKGSSMTNSERAALAQTMSHSQHTADQYYKAEEEARNREGFQVVGKILKVAADMPPPKKRLRFTEERTTLIKTYFEDDIAQKLMPSTPALKKFLAEMGELFIGRKHGDIYSKICNIIGCK